MMRAFHSPTGITVVKIRGGWVYIDSEDFYKIENLTWHVRTDHKSKYAGSTTPMRDGYKSILMHRLIMGCPKGLVIDHINHNALDNRKTNLRICTNSENRLNTLKHIKATSKYKGVCKWGGKWRTQIQYKRNRYVKDCATEEEAAIEYNRMATRLHGSFACLNVVPNQKDKEVK